MDLRMMYVDKEGKAQFGFGLGSPKRSVGIDKLVQLFLVMILKTPGRDISSIDTGGGFLSVVQGNVDPDNIAEIAAELAPRIRKVENELKYDQIDKEIASDEKLLSAVLGEILVDATNPTSYEINITITSEAGTERVVAVDSALIYGG
jgi:diaminopimelate decarboxylase